VSTSHTLKLVSLKIFVNGDGILTMLRTVGRILPVTRENVTLEALLEDGSRVSGESEINRCARKIRRLSVQPRRAAPTPGVIEAILRRTWWFSAPAACCDLLPNIVIDGVGAVARHEGPQIVANLVSDAARLPA
jgi:2-phospho-L-lactate transferase/gluconeogenesis factor (CofD/UPF0052 family)